MLTCCEEGEEDGFNGSDGGDGGDVGGGGGVAGDGGDGGCGGNDCDGSRGGYRNGSVGDNVSDGENIDLLSEACTCCEEEED